MCPRFKMQCPDSTVHRGRLGSQLHALPDRHPSTSRWAGHLDWGRAWHGIVHNADTDTCACISLTSAMKNRMFGRAGAPWPNDESESAARCEAGGVVVARGPCWSEVTNTTRHSRAGRCTCPTDTAIDGLGTVSCNAHCAVLHRPSVHKCKCVWIWGTQFTPCKPITVTSLSLSHV
jgi:hypothetical protein